MFETFGTPQIFATYSCDADSPGQTNLARYLHGPAARTTTDPVAFTKHWKEAWSRFFKFVLKTWGPRRVGGIKAWTWVLELQDRGTPHTHFCLWTNNSIAEMIRNGIITCASAGRTVAETALIQRHQVHQCTPYCQGVGMSQACRFGYPHAVSANATHLDADSGRYIYQRLPGDERINPYILEWLKYCHVNIDTSTTLAQTASGTLPSILLSRLSQDVVL
jgi:hypothetical protein